MDVVVQYSVNIAMEATMLLLLAVLLITCLLQRKLFSTTLPFIFLLSFIILMLLDQIIVWAMLIRKIPYFYGAAPMRIVYFFDYLFTYSASVAFFYYVRAFIRDGYKQIGVTYIPRKHAERIVIAWGIINTLLYGAMLYFPAIYHVENGVAVFSIPAYIFMHIMSKFAAISTIALIIYHRKVIGKQERYLSLAFIFLVSLFIVVDELFGLCISYVLMSLLALIIYVRVDMNKGLLLERQEKEMVEWKTKIMLSQMQPHFLYNVFTTISGLCETQNALQARDVVNRFADYFRTNIESLGKEKTISFEKELNHIKTYLWLEKLRFEDDLIISYEIGPMDFAVPSLTIQPIVENAVKHGVVPKDSPGTVTIKTYETSTDYVIVVEDDGVGFDVDEKRDSGVHVGLENVSKRLEIVLGGSIEIQSEKEKGTVVTVQIPKGDR